MSRSYLCRCHNNFTLQHYHKHIRGTAFCLEATEVRIIVTHNNLLHCVQVCLQWEAAARTRAHLVSQSKKGHLPTLTGNCRSQESHSEVHNAKHLKEVTTGHFMVKVTWTILHSHRWAIWTAVSEDTASGANSVVTARASNTDVLLKTVISICAGGWMNLL